VAIFSTGNEIVAPGCRCVRRRLRFQRRDHRRGRRGIGGVAVHLGVIPDDEDALASALAQGLECDLVIFSGGTSKGEGDFSYRVVGRLRDPGVVVHGVALNPASPSASR
jgi:putative molybdopterin biosynthesis protein